MKRIKVCMFDVYGTLFDVYSLQELCESFFPGKGGDIVRLWRQKQLEYSFLRHMMQQYETFHAITEAALRYACESMGEELRREQEQQLMGQYLHLSLHPDALELLARCEGKVMAVFSNGSPDMLLPLLQHAGITGLFQHHISVDALKMYKPDPRVYEFARSTAGVDKDEILFFSSNTWDISGAGHFGFRTVWVNRNGGKMDRLGVQPEYEVASLREAAAFL
ncbi:haloacid dehalogenase type II [Ectobacillus ponti]|uniref:Haloacid dehalogenase type II n=1 Tax=Ectobacillus ponti TaxID=2961894 RepID=A0AA42BMU7_9BACI|nr:haloacid dehalogenase type II [Ectobacillus ponti]MCP8967240.1 haloacid dehalogenase type II [Ectobacillus ponti]